jgi:hypothetical protein
MTPRQEPQSPSSNGQPAAAIPLRRGALALTNLTKLAGLVVAVNEAVLRTELRPSVIALAAFMMAGAQVSETLLLSVIERFFEAREDR